MIEHYKKLWYFYRHRLKGEYSNMRAYFADVVIGEIEQVVSLYNKKVLDVGGARGEFCRVLAAKRYCRTNNLDPCIDAYDKYSTIEPFNTIKGYAEHMPLKSQIYDVILCRGVIEHIEYQPAALSEMYRVLKPGGILYISIPPWYNPTGGHGLKPFHYLPFPIAKFLAQRLLGKKIPEKSYSEKRLYKTACRSLLRIARGFKVVKVYDTHLRLHWLARVPLLREFCVPMVAYVMRKV